MNIAEDNTTKKQQKRELKNKINKETTKKRAQK
jgi:hypothetical protein